MGIVEDVYEGQLEHVPARGFVDGDGSERRLEGRAARHRQTPEGYVMTRSEQHDAMDHVAPGLEGDERACGDRSGVHETRVGRDQRFGPR